MLVEVQERGLDRDELDALIKEARRRARRRRLGYAAMIALAGVTASGLYIGFYGNGGNGAVENGQPSPSGGAGAQRPASQARQANIYAHRCPPRGLEALPLTNGAEPTALRLTRMRVGPPPGVSTHVRPATDAGARGDEVSWMCGPRVARRTLVAFTWDRRFDSGPNTSASLAQHVSFVSRFDDGYRIWYWEH